MPGIWWPEGTSQATKEAFGDLGEGDGMLENDERFLEEVEKKKQEMAEKKRLQLKEEDEKAGRSCPEWVATNSVVDNKWKEIVAEGAADDNFEQKCQDDRQVNTSEYDPEEVLGVLENGEKLKKQGNEAFAEGSKAKAMNTYIAVLDLLHKLHIYSCRKKEMCPLEQIAPAKRPSWPVWERAKALALSCLLNLTQVYLEFGRYKDAAESATAALNIAQRKSVKALWRRAVARTHMEDFDGAYSDLKAAAKLEPQDRKIRQELERVKGLRDPRGQPSKEFTGWANRAAEAHQQKDMQKFQEANKKRCEDGKDEMTWDEFVELEEEEYRVKRKSADFVAKFGTAGFTKQMNELGDVLEHMRKEEAKEKEGNNNGQENETGQES
mmetsp:Transcript_72351/g.125444  ORF Transcript_72351/g.125444 Transcript_72351/m.125444 type:complete len:381 (+) Transcript_72351:84-1226(+)